jgi:hypothetical protein
MSKQMLFLPLLPSTLFITSSIVVGADTIQTHYGNQFFDLGDRYEMTQPIKTAQQYSHSAQLQKTFVNLSPKSLKLPNVLTISAPVDVQLKGAITANGSVIQKLQGNRATLNLSPYLSSGKKTIEILGSYQPKEATVSVKFSGPETTITQQTGGNGTLRQLLIFEIRE